MGGADQPEVRLLRVDAAHSAVAPRFQQPQQFDLQLQGDIPDLVKEQGAAPGRLHQAGLAQVGAGKGPLFMTEQLALEQALGETRALHRDEHAVGPGAVLVDGAGHQFLAGAGFPEQQHRCIAGCHPLHQFEHAAERR